MKHLFTTLACCFTFGICAAQTDTTATPVLSVEPSTTLQTTLPAATAPVTPASPEMKQDIFRKNGVKMNLSSLAFSNYSFSYERAIARKITLVGGYSILPESKAGAIPLVEKGMEIAEIGTSEDGEDGEDEITDILDNATISSNAITGEVRFYTGKKPGARGFYASVYGRYTTMNLTHNYLYEATAGQEIEVPIVAKLNGFGGGVMLGSQWLIAKRVTFDWYIVGGHYGKISGDLTGKTDLSALSAEDKADLEAELEDIASNGDRKYIDVTVNDNGIFGKANGPFGGIRGLGFNIGIAF